MFRRIWAWLVDRWRRWRGKAPAARYYGRLDSNGVFWYGSHRPLDTDETALDVFEVDRRLRRHGDGDKWAEAFTVLETAAAADKMAALSPALADNVAAQKRAAFDNLVALARKVFDVKAVNGSGDGWSDAACFMLLADYVTNLAALGSEFLPLPKPLARPAESASPQGGSLSGSGSTASA
jgi:hypothetical protein